MGSRPHRPCADGQPAGGLGQERLWSDGLALTLLKWVWSPPGLSGKRCPAALRPASTRVPTRASALQRQTRGIPCPRPRPLPRKARRRRTHIHTGSSDSWPPRERRIRDGARGAPRAGGETGRTLSSGAFTVRRLTEDPVPQAQLGKGKGERDKTFFPPGGGE